MPNGRPGDHPYTDIVHHHRLVYSPTADALVREIDGLADERTRTALADRLFGEYNDSLDPDVPALELELTALRDRLLREAAERGFDG